MSYPPQESNYPPVVQSYGPGAPPTPVRKRKSNVGIILGVIAAVFAMVCGGAIACTAFVASNVPDAPGNGSGATTVGLNQPARDGKFEFTVTAVQCGLQHIGPASFGADAQGQYCLVKLTVSNIGDQAQTFTGSNVYGFNAAGQKYDADSTAAIYLDGDARSLYENINPGNTVDGTVAFDIPLGQSLTKLELRDSAFSGGVVVNL